jgi:hypothetical protein
MKGHQKKKWVVPTIAKISIIRETKSGSIELVEVRQANSRAHPVLGKLDLIPNR